MTPGEFKEIAKAMHEFGIHSVKMGDVMILRESTRASKFTKGLPLPVQDLENDPVKHKIDEMASLMKLSDSELVDQLFPDQSEESA